MRWLLIILALYPTFSYAKTIQCKIVGIIDGDTVTCLTQHKKRITVRLYQIGAPEKNQDFANQSKQTLSRLIFNQTVTVETQGKDKYARTLGTIYIEWIVCSNPTIMYSDPKCIIRRNINREMIELGMAWYKPVNEKNSLYQQAESYAKTNKIGLWSQHTIAP